MSVIRELWDLTPPMARGALMFILALVFTMWVRSQTINNATAVLEAQRALHREHLAFCQEAIRELREELEECRDDQSTEIGGAGQWREGHQPR